MLSLHRPAEWWEFAHTSIKPVTHDIDSAIAIATVLPILHCLVQFLGPVKKIWHNRRAAWTPGLTWDPYGKALHWYPFFSRSLIIHHKSFEIDSKLFQKTVVRVAGAYLRRVDGHRPYVQLDQADHDIWSRKTSCPYWTAVWPTASVSCPLEGTQQCHLGHCNRELRIDGFRDISWSRTYILVALAVSAMIGIDG